LKTVFVQGKMQTLVTMIPLLVVYVLFVEQWQACLVLQMRRIGLDIWRWEAAPRLAYITT